MTTTPSVPPSFAISASHPSAHSGAALLAGRVLAGAALVLVALHASDFAALPAAPFHRSLFMPHLAALGFGPLGREIPLQPLLVSLALGLHGLALFGAIVAICVAGTRARHAAWTPPLTLGLGALCFYVAQFGFVHPGAPLAPTTAGTRVLDYVAAAALGLGAWSFARFIWRFPVAHDLEAFCAHVHAQTVEQQSVAQRSRSAVRRWIARPRALDRGHLVRVSRFQRWQAAAFQSPGFAVAVGLGGMALAFIAPLQRSRPDGFLLATIGLGYALMFLLLMGAMQAAAVLVWLRRAGPESIRPACTRILRWSNVGGVVVTIAFISALGGTLFGRDIAYLRGLAVLAFLPPLALIGFLFGGAAIARASATDGGAKS